MRIQHIKIDGWRHFENIRLDVPDSAPVVCMVGGNGTGKSQILELISASAHRLGLSPGFESGRGNPFSQGGTFEVQFYIAPGAVGTLDEEMAVPDDLQEVRPLWDRTLVVKKSEDGSVNIAAGGIEDLEWATKLAGHLVTLIRLSASVHYLMLDADRAYPRIQVESHEIGTAFETDWDTTTKAKSHLLTKSLYEEWFRYLLGTENRENNAHIAAIRLAREKNKREPRFVDKMAGYRDSIKKVLPHLLFTGIDSQRRQIHFDSTGISLTFDQLSGGEREIAFLVGQIDRFGLRKGLLLVDEPELHLNYDLLRSWIGYLKGTVEEGQIWLASHSLEVVEVTGQDATFLLERDEDTRRVVSGMPVASRPVVSTLSRAVGSPAFSIARLSFVLVEGEEEIGERERFQALMAGPRDVRFIEAGNCREVLRRIESLQAIAKASNEHLKIGGVIDGDWRDQSERDELALEGIHVLAVHEVENFLLHPPTVKSVIAKISSTTVYDEVLRAAADRRAGSWIFDAARTSKQFEDYPAPDAPVRELVHSMTWADFDDIPVAAQKIVDTDSQLEPNQREKLKKHIQVRARSFARIRESDELWKRCEGKEVFRSIAQKIGFSDSETAERAIMGAWDQDETLVPEELKLLRSFVEQLRQQ